MKRFLWTARVYWEDTDGGGVVYYANYLKYLERARSEWLRARGVEQTRLRAESGIVFAVARVEVEYRAPARLDDELSISCEPGALVGVRLEFAQHIWRGPADGELLVAARVRAVCVDAQTFRPRRLPRELIAELN